jgi:hypothetical protein
MWVATFVPKPVGKKSENLIKVEEEFQEFAMELNKILAHK